VIVRIASRRPTDDRRAHARAMPRPPPHHLRTAPRRPHNPAPLRIIQPPDQRAKSPPYAAPLSDRGRVMRPCVRGLGPSYAEL
jgi:hypothetical protein